MPMRTALIAVVLLLLSGSSQANSYVLPTTYHVWGLPGDVPVPADYDGDGKLDPATYRPSSGTWWVLSSRASYTEFVSVHWGTEGDIPLPGDYDGSQLTQVAVYRPSTGEWFVLGSIFPRRVKCEAWFPGCLNY